MDKKGIVFWGNINIHVYPIAKALAIYNKVYIIIDSNSFTNQTERIPHYTNQENIEIIDAKDSDIKTIVSLFDNENTIHINTGLKFSSNISSKALKLLLKNKATIFSLPQEGFQLHNVKGIINKIKWFIYINFIYKHIKGFGLTGENAFNDFKTIRCNINSRCFPCLYATSLPDINTYSPHEEFNITFVGGINKRKNIQTIIKWIIDNKKIMDCNFRFHIYGRYNKNEAKDFLTLIKRHQNFIYHDVVSNEEIQKALNQSDLLILPSLYDGWGAVVNEALQCGSQVLVSNKCGSECLIRNRSFLGKVFNVNNKNDFTGKLLYFLQKGVLSTKEREEIKEWSATHISPDVVAKYLNEIFEFYCSKTTNNKPTAPWI